ncbi:MAG: DUF126 domain-containing protein [Thermaerobacter sp.]|nr:DUF126 domain-containing protein [Thermaerobacter sp.]
MSEQFVKLARAYGARVEGPLLVSADGFSPRYDLDRATGVVTRVGHSLYGHQLAGSIVAFPTAKGGVAAGWAFLDLHSRGLAPLAFIFGITNSVMVHGAVMAGVPIADGLSVEAWEQLRTARWAELRPAKRDLRLVT